MPHNQVDIEQLDEELLTKTQQKKEMQELQSFAMRLANLTKHQRTQVELSEELLAALVLADKIKTKPEALSRHVRFVARMLNDMDIEPIKKSLNFLTNKNQERTIHHQKLEKLRDELLNKDNSFVEEILSGQENFDRQKIKQLIRSAKKELKAEKIGKHHQTLLQYLKLNYIK